MSHSDEKIVEIIKEIPFSPLRSDTLLTSRLKVKAAIEMERERKIAAAEQRISTRREALASFDPDYTPGASTVKGLDYFSVNGEEHSKLEKKRKAGGASEKVAGPASIISYEITFQELPLGFSAGIKASPTGAPPIVVTKVRKDSLMDHIGLYDVVCTVNGAPVLEMSQLSEATLPIVVGFEHHLEHHTSAPGETERNDEAPSLRYEVVFAKAPLGISIVALPSPNGELFKVSNITNDALIETISVGDVIVKVNDLPATELINLVKGEQFPIAATFERNVQITSSRDAICMR